MFSPNNLRTSRRLRRLIVGGKIEESVFKGKGNTTNRRVTSALAPVVGMFCASPDTRVCVNRPILPQWAGIGLDGGKCALLSEDRIIPLLGFAAQVTDGARKDNKRTVQ